MKQISLPCDAIEARLGMDAPTVRARVINADDDATLLRMLTDGVEMD